MTNLDMPQTLSARQIDWCRQNIKSFSVAWLAVQSADAHRRAVYDKLGVRPDEVFRRAYPGPPYGITATHQAQVNADLLAFLKG